MTVLAFDTLAYVKRLRDAGIDSRQAEAQAEALAEAVGGSVATKADVERLDNRITQVAQQIDARIDRLDAKSGGRIDTLGGRIDTLAAELRGEIRDAQVNMIKWLVPLMLGQTAILAALVKLL